MNIKNLKTNKIVNIFVAKVNLLIHINFLNINFEVLFVFILFIIVDNCGYGCLLRYLHQPIPYFEMPHEQSSSP